MSASSLDDVQASVESLRRMFSAFEDGLARFDGPGAAQMPSPVMEAMQAYLRTANANLGGVFGPSVASEAVVADARRALAAFVGAEPDEVGFGLNATALNFQLALAAVRDLRPGDEIVGYIAPWLQAAADRGLVIRTAGVGTDTRLDMDELATLIGGRTRIVAFPWANNVVGTMVDVPEVVRLAHAGGAIAWADATHYLPHGPVDVHETGVDVLIGSAYKFFGPHVGVFYVRRDLAASWRPYQLDHAAHASGAVRFETGTPPFEALAGVTAALGYLGDVGWTFVQDSERRLAERFLTGLPDAWQLHGVPTAEHRTATFALTLPGHDSHRLARALADRRLAVGAGDFHAPAVLRALGLHNGVLRVGFLHYTTDTEVDRLLIALTDLANRPFGR